MRLATLVVDGQVGALPPAVLEDATVREQGTTTAREQSVLAYLPTLSTNSEIVDQLSIAVNTVKQHLKAINRKVGWAPGVQDLFLGLDRAERLGVLVPCLDPCADVVLQGLGAALEEVG